MTTRAQPIRPKGAMRAAPTISPFLTLGPADTQPCLSVADVAAHYRLTPATVGAMLRAGTLAGLRINRQWRLSWSDVWAAEAGPRPQGTRREALRRPLLRKADLAAAYGVSVRTVERWLADGLPTRNVGSSVRIAPTDAEAWLAYRFGGAVRAEGL